MKVQNFLILLICMTTAMSLVGAMLLSSNASGIGGSLRGVGCAAALGVICWRRRESDKIESLYYKRRNQKFKRESGNDTASAGAEIICQ